jgi:hypothetical protein
MRSFVFAANDALVRFEQTIKGNEDAFLLGTFTVLLYLTLVYKIIFWTKDDWINNEVVAAKHFGLCLLTVPMSIVFLNTGRTLAALLCIPLFIVTGVHACWTVVLSVQWDQRVLPLVRHNGTFWKTRKQHLEFGAEGGGGVKRCVRSSVDIAIC